MIKAQLLVDELQLLSNRLNTSLSKMDYKLNSRLATELNFLIKVISHAGLSCDCVTVNCYSDDGKEYTGVSSLRIGINNLDVFWDECQDKFHFVNRYISAHLHPEASPAKLGLMSMELPDGSCIYSMLYEHVTFRDVLVYFSGMGNFFCNLPRIEKERLSCEEYAEYSQGKDCNFAVDVSFHNDGTVIINSVNLRFMECPDVFKIENGNGE